MKNRVHTAAAGCTIVVLGSVGAVASCSPPLCSETATCAGSAVVQDAAVADDSNVGTDAGGDAASVNPCDPLTRGDAFCWDFSEDGGANSLLAHTPKYETYSYERGTGASVTFPDGFYRSPPRSGRVEFTAQGLEGAAQLVATASVPAQPHHVRFSSFLYLEKMPSGDVRLNALAFFDNTGPRSAEFSVGVNSDGAVLLQELRRFSRGLTKNVILAPVPLARTIPLGAWTRLSIEVSTGEAPFVRVEIDGIEVAHRSVEFVGPIRRVSVFAGMSADTAVGDAAMFVDDIAVEHLPEG